MLHLLINIIYGEKIKPNTFYKLVDGEPVEID